MSGSVAVGNGMGPSLAKAEGTWAVVGLRGCVCGSKVGSENFVSGPAVGIWAEEGWRGVQGLLSCT